MYFPKLLLFLLLSFASNGQTYCPGDTVYEVIATDSIIVHQSSYQTSFGCWNDLTEFLNLPTTTFPSGLDVAIIITDYVGTVGSIVDHVNLNPVNLGDTLYIRKNNVGYNVRLRHIAMAGFDYELVIFGVPTEFNETHNCTYIREGVFYPSNCLHTGYVIVGSGNCETCDLAGLIELSADTKKLIMITDLLGRKTEDKSNSLLIYLYNDGTVEKVYRVE